MRLWYNIDVPERERNRKEMTAMTINIFINYKDKGIDPMTESQFRASIEETAIEMSADRKLFDEWAYINYTPTELLNLTESQRVGLRELWMDACRIEAIQQMYDTGWEERWIEIPLP